MKLTLTILTSVLLTLPVALRASDWPMWRFDRQRSGATAQALPRELKLDWSRELGKPDPAFDYHFRLCADQSYEPVAANGVLFVPSNVGDSVTAYDLVSGAVKWRFVAEGPVRFAPVVANDRVWFASDDGFLYCVDAATGALRWKTRGAPEDRADYRMLVNDRLCSRWPARGGPVLQGDTIFFGCGLWPSEGVFALAVDANSGAVKWRNADISQIADGLEEHGKMADLGLPPHGYFAWLGDKLAMPSGRAIAAFLDPRIGKLDAYNSFYGKGSQTPRGAWAVGGNADYWCQGGSMYGTTAAALEKLPAGPLTVEDFAKLCGQTTKWVEELIAKKTVRVKMENGARLVLFDPRAPAIGAFPGSKFGIAPNQAAEVKARPIAQTPGASTRHEIGDVDLPVFTDRLMFRNEHVNEKDSVVVRGDTRVRPVSYTKICAYDLRDASWGIDLAEGRKGESLQRRLRFPKVWELAAPLTVRIAAGDRLYAAGENKIAAIAIPAVGGKPGITWEAKVDGYPIGVIAANDQLIVTTDKGALYCFGAGADGAQTLTAKPAEIPTSAEWKDRAADLLKRTPSSGGYALVLGWNSGGLVRELVRQSALNVIVIESDSALAMKVRDEFSNAGLRGSRVQVVSGSAEPLRLPLYFAEVVASEDFAALGDGGRTWSTGALDALRPFTGVALLPLRPKLRELAEAHGKSLGGFIFESGKGQWTYISRAAAPKGADDWTHENANVGNTFASADTLAVPPFALLWYSGGIDRYFTPQWEYQHNRNPYPVIAAGRMFLLAGNVVDAVDAYTGRHLWKTTVPPSDKAERRTSDHRMFSRPADQNVVATADRLYVFRDADAQVLDAHTGKTLATFALTEKDFGADAKAHWDEARVVGDTLFVAAGKHLVAMDRQTGAVRWHRASALDRIAFTLGESHVFLVDYALPRAAETKAAGSFESRIFVVNADDGKAAWDAPLTMPGRPAQAETSAGRPRWSGIFMDNPLKPVLVYNTAHRIVLAVVDRHQYFAYDATNGRPLWNKTMASSLSALVKFEPPMVTSDLFIANSDEIFDIRTGQPAGPKQIGGRGTGCNRVVGSDALVTFRSALACVLDLSTQKRTYLSSTRSGCTNGMIPAGGLLNSPNFAHGCVCNYPFLTSFALVHLPDAAKWAPPKAPSVQFQRNPNTE